MDEKELIEKFNRLEHEIKEDTFYQNKGLSNDVGYYIFDYNPKLELFAREKIHKIINKTNNNDYSFNIKEFDLYHLLFEIIKDEGYFEDIFALEKDMGTDKTLKTIQNMIKVGHDESLLVNYILDNHESNDIIFITGIGKVYPMLRSRDILYDLEVIDVPLVVFYPGTYTGIDLKLFDEIEDENYYRAIKF